MRRKKRLIPTLFLAVLAWVSLGVLIFGASPSDLPPRLLFFILLFLACLLSFALLLNSTRRGLLIALGITSLAILRLFNLFHPLYIVLTFGLLLTIELYFLKK